MESSLNRFTFLPSEEIADLTSVTGAALQEAKRVLAYEAMALVHGVEAAEAAQRVATALFSRTDASPSGASGVSLPTTAIPATAMASLTLADAFVRAGLVESRGEARRLTTQGGLQVDDVTATDIDVPLATALGDRAVVLLRAGKKRFRRVAIVPD